jgi:hypothetical protein
VQGLSYPIDFVRLPETSLDPNQRFFDLFFFLLKVGSGPGIHPDEDGDVATHAFYPAVKRSPLGSRIHQPHHKELIVIKM